jgi:hypothetical protein
MDVSLSKRIQIERDLYVLVFLCVKKYAKEQERANVTPCAAARNVKLDFELELQRVASLIGLLKARDYRYAVLASLTRNIMRV